MAAESDTDPTVPDRTVEAAGKTPSLDFPQVYRAWFGAVCRWLRALGIPDSDREDVAQEVFVVVERKLTAFDGRHLQAWLYRISARTASDHRRRAWWRNLFSRGGDGTRLDERRHAGPDPAEALDRKERRRQLFELLDQLSHKRRTTLALFEIEGYSCEEIAALQGISPVTVRTRIHEARKELFALVAKLPESKERP